MVDSRTQPLVLGLLLLCGCVGLLAAPATGQTGDNVTVNQTTLGGAGEDTLTSVVVTGNRTVVAGSTSSFGASADIWLAGYDQTGTERWNETVPSPGREVVTDLATAPEGYVVVGHTSATRDGSVDGFVARVDSEGALVDADQYGGPSRSEIRAVTRTASGEYVLAGVQRSPDGDADGWLFAINASGGVQWQLTTGGSNDEFFTDLTRADRRLVAVGSTTSVVGEQRAGLAVGVTPDGQRQWTQRYDRGANQSLNAIAASESGYVAAGWQEPASGGGVENMWAVRLGSEGSLQDAQTYGGPGLDEAHDVQAVDEGYVLVGERDGTNSTEAVVFRANESGVDWDIRTGSQSAALAVAGTEAGVRAVGFTTDAGISDGLVLDVSATQSDSGEEGETTLDGTGPSQNTSHSSGLGPAQLAVLAVLVLLLLVVGQRLRDSGEG
jgi:hypothetical protein